MNINALFINIVNIEHYYIYIYIYIYIFISAIIHDLERFLSSSDKFGGAIQN